MEEQRVKSPPSIALNICGLAFKCEMNGTGRLRELKPGEPTPEELRAQQAKALEDSRG